ncbi:hypothetical protein [Sulfitobacter mediterraneus]|uniref:hypothetical protein n=1 Tax=Sulfitobacter mediterraneus TaxID=83219 RepID=UPI0021A88DE6|nr:hypothetical protein [Sulfitobacter mediterraneus]UWR10956.1 hypothetical protein K3753_17155 [Sulfitobacter mediterraneus]
MMEWSSDTFTLDDARDVLTFFSAEDVSEKNCAVLHQYLAEIPPPHDFDTYVAYHDQLAETARRPEDTGRKEAELWLWALTVRVLSFEVEQGFVGPVRELLSNSSYEGLT